MSKTLAEKWTQIFQAEGGSDLSDGVHGNRSVAGGCDVGAERTEHEQGATTLLCLLRGLIWPSGKTAGFGLCGRNPMIGRVL